MTTRGNDQGSLRRVTHAWARCFGSAWHPHGQRANRKGTMTGQAKTRAIRSE